MIRPWGLVALLITTGCASAQVDHAAVELRAARAAFAKAKSGGADRIAPVRLEGARRELVLAERAAADGRDQDAVAHAQIAKRRSAAASADVDASLALRRQAAAATELASLRAKWRATAPKPAPAPAATAIAAPEATYQIGAPIEPPPMESPPVVTPASQ